MLLVMQDNNLAVAACSALSQMSFIAPDLVLPLVQTRFQVGLGFSPTAWQYMLLQMLVLAIHFASDSCAHVLQELCLLRQHFPHAMHAGQHLSHVMPAGSYICYAMHAGQTPLSCYACWVIPFLCCACWATPLLCYIDNTASSNPPGFWLQKLPLWRLAAVPFVCFPFSQPDTSPHTVPPCQKQWQPASTA